MTFSRVFAIDPGLEGGYALIDSGRLVTAGCLPTIGDGSRRRLSVALFASLVNEWMPQAAIIEEVSAMPKQGVSSTFRFGRAVGAIESVLGVIGAMHTFPLISVTPQQWKKHFRIPGKMDGGAERSRQLALERWPEKAALFARKKDHNRAEAALIALWFVETHSSRVAQERVEPPRPEVQIAVSEVGV